MLNTIGALLPSAVIFPVLLHVDEIHKDDPHGFSRNNIIIAIGGVILVLSIIFEVGLGECLGFDMVF